MSDQRKGFRVFGTTRAYGIYRIVQASRHPEVRVASGVEVRLREAEQTK